MAEIRTLEEVQRERAPIGSYMNPVDLEAIEARADGATEGPWFLKSAHTGIRGSEQYAWVGPRPSDNDDVNVVIPVVERQNGGTLDDMNFIEHARQDVPALVRTVRALTSQNAIMRNREVNALRDVAQATEALHAAEQKIREHDTTYALLATGFKEATSQNREYTDALKADLRMMKAALGTATAGGAKAIERLGEAEEQLRQAVEKIETLESEKTDSRNHVMELTTRINTVEKLVNSDATYAALMGETDPKHLADLVRDLRRILA